MVEGIRRFVNYQYQDIPMWVYEGLLLSFCIGTVCILILFGWTSGLKKIIGLFLAEYVLLILCSTVFFRSLTEGFDYCIHPFWSYVAIQNGRNDLVPVIIMNVLVFIPVGLLVGLISVKKQNLLKAGIIALCSGLCVSVLIELLQFLLKRGLAELDDVIHNTLGCLIGFMIVVIIKGVWQSCSYLFVPQWKRNKDIKVQDYGHR